MLRIGTSSWSSEDWKAAGFYPAGLEPRDYLEHYARRYDTVEVDSSYYRSPAPSACARWREVTPPEFRFSLKVPSAITHGKALADCGADWEAFLRAVAPLGDKLAFLVLQFGYFNRDSACPDLATFLARLGPFLEKAAAPCPVVVEIRNKPWIHPELLALLRERRSPLAFAWQEWMPKPEALWAKHGRDLVTAGAVYVRFLGERKRIEAITKAWDKTVIDRGPEIESAARLIAELIDLDLPVWTYFNNHYAGHAPASAELFRAAMERLNAAKGGGSASRS
jgi:uncharacterized protein YecE (DUF72 family)